MSKPQPNYNDMDGETFSKMWDTIKDKKTDFTLDEVNKFQKAFDDPEFRKLFASYMEEIQDPSYREETEQYISQLEGEDKVPAGKELIRPTSGFVAKTKKVDKDGKDTDKVFINIVYSDKINKPVSSNSKEGTHWSLPYSLGPPHMEKDHTGDATYPAFDCCYHPSVIDISNANSKFKNLLVQTAIDGIEEAYRKQKQDVKLNKDFRILKGIGYKSGKIPTLLVDKASKEKWNDTGISSTSKDIDNNTAKKDEVKKDEVASKAPSKVAPAPAPATTTQAPVAAPAPAAKSKDVISQPAIKKGFLNSSSKPSSPPKNSLVREVSPDEVDQIKSKTIVNKVPKESETDANPKHPIYTVKERGSLGLGDFENSKNKVFSNRPSELIYTFHVSAIKSAAGLNLDVAEKEIKLTYEDIYDLTLVLPYPVFDKKGAAKFDKSAKTLTVTLPVKPHVASNYTTSPSSEPEVKESEKVDAADNTISNTKEEKNNDNNNNDKANAVKHNRWVNKDNLLEEEEKNRQLKGMIKKLEQEALLNPPTPPAVPVTSKTNEISEEILSSDDTSEPFIASAKFDGFKAGYKFQKGELGIGYYIDSKQKKVNKLKSTTATSSTSSSTKVNDENIRNDNNANIETIPFDVKQTKTTVSLLVQVANILISSVKISFENKSFTVSFDSIDNGKTTKYGTKFDLCGSIDPSKCSYDVANKNMVVILMKADEKYWQDRLAVPDSSYNPSATTSISAATTSNSMSSGSSSSIKSPAASKVNDKVENVQDEVLNNIRNMTFKSDVLFELD